jgi:glycosyltransferase involved in cell wall biosynthesis
VRICSPQISLKRDSNLGGAVYDYEVLKSLAALGVELQIPHLFAADAVVPPGWHVHQLPLRRPYGLGAIATNLAFARGLGAVARGTRPDLIRVAYPWYSGPASILVGRRLGIPTAVVFHHLEETESLPERLVHRLVAERATGVHTGSRFAARQLAERYGIREENVAVIPYGVSSAYRPDEAARRRVREERGLAGRIVLLHVGALIARKNLLFLVEVFERLSDPQAILLLCGEGYPRDGYAGRLRARIEASPARARIRLLGRVPEAVKRDLYHASDVLVHPARVEGFGLSVAEAMASGRAALVSRAGSLPEIVEEEVTGLLASPDCVEEFTEKLRRLVSDASLRERLGARAAADIARRFAWERTATASLRFYESLT